MSEFTPNHICSCGWGGEILSGSISEEQRKAADELKQVHDYARHTFQMFLSWFTVFATVNYAAMGWLAGLSANGQQVRLPFAVLVPGMFVVQNIFALVCSREVWISLNNQAAEARRLGGSDRAIPARLYFRAIFLIAIAVGFTALAWVGVGIVLTMPTASQCPT